MVPSSDAGKVVLDPFERLLRVRVALDEITDSEESIAVGVEGEDAGCVNPWTSPTTTSRP